MWIKFKFLRFTYVTIVLCGFVFCSSRLTTCYLIRSLLDTKMADVSSADRKQKVTKNGKVVKKRLRNPEGGFVVLSFKTYILYFVLQNSTASF